MSSARLIASCFGLGRVRIAPGTVGSLFGVACFALLLAPASLFVQVAAVLGASVIGVAAATAVTRELGREDPQEVVIDELAGMWLAMLGTTGWMTWTVAFLLFRLFDVTKPFPVRNLEALPEGWGIVADDLAAGAYAGIATWLVMRWIG